MRIGQRFFDFAQLAPELLALIYFIRFFHADHLTISATAELPHPTDHGPNALDFVLTPNRPGARFAAFHFSHQLQFEGLAITNHVHRYLGFSVPKYQPISGRDLGYELPTTNQPMMPICTTISIPRASVLDCGSPLP